MFRVTIFLSMYLVHALSNFAPCTEDSHCSIGFYCEETTLYCRQCLRCEDLKREPPPQRDLCVKSVAQCGDCLKGILAETRGKEGIGTGCVSTVGEIGKHHPYLPTYAWVAIGIGLFLMLLTICVLLKIKMFKVVSYSSRTSVHSLRTIDAPERESVPPPPYNYHLPSNYPPGPAAPESPEIRRLVDSPELCAKPAPDLEASRPREAVGNQEARVFNNPAYVRVPQSQIRCNTPEMPPPAAETLAPIPATFGADSSRDVQPSGNIAKTDRDDVNSTYARRSNSQNLENNPRTMTHSTIKACTEVQDSNNNHPPEESLTRGAKGLDGTRIIGGPSFVINVVENINNLHQRNHANCYLIDSSQ